MLSLDATSTNKIYVNLLAIRAQCSHIHHYLTLNHIHCSPHTAAHLSSRCGVVTLPRDSRRYHVFFSSITKFRRNGFLCRANWILLLKQKAVDATSVSLFRRHFSLSLRCVCVSIAFVFLFFSTKEQKVIVFVRCLPCTRNAPSHPLKSQSHSVPGQTNKDALRNWMWKRKTNGQSRMHEPKRIQNIHRSTYNLGRLWFVCLGRAMYTCACVRAPCVSFHYHSMIVFFSMTVLHAYHCSSRAHSFTAQNGITKKTFREIVFDWNGC